MAATNFTPISLYYSTTAAAVPTSGNLVAGELALNTADMKLYAKNSSGVVTLLASNSSSTNVASITFGTTGLTPSTATTGAVTVAGTLAVANGGTGVTSSTGSASVVLSTSPTIITPIIRNTVSVIGTNTTAVASTTYILTATLTLTLPATPTAGDRVMVNNSSGTTTPVIGRNGSNIQSLAEDMTINSATASFTLTYADATRGWVLTL